MVYKNATLEDLKSIVKVHKKCFKNSFSSKIGNYLLKKYYLLYLDHYPNLFYVAKEDQEVVGFCMGYLCNDHYLTKTFIRHYKIPMFLRCVFLTLIFNKQMWNKIFNFFKKKKSKYEIIDNDFSNVNKKEIGDLLSICVLESYRGKGISYKLMDLFCYTLKGLNISYCVLTVNVENTHALSFYNRNGFELYKKNNDHYILKKMLNSQ